MIVGFHHLGISVPDLDAAVEFYTKAFGVAVVFTEEWDGVPAVERATGLTGSAARGVFFQWGPHFFELHEYSAPDPQDPDSPRRPCDRGINHFCVEVTDILEEVERLGELGMTFPSEPQHVGGGSYVVYGRDPFGNIIEIQQVAGDFPNLRDWQYHQIPHIDYATLGL
jgi:lactoylglutathione lyase/glyoxylase I family protein